LISAGISCASALKIGFQKQPPCVLFGAHKLQSSNSRWGR
jgi:hypothetical protein